MDVITISDTESSGTPVFIMQERPIGDSQQNKNWNLHLSPSPESKVTKWLYNNPIDNSDRQLPKIAQFLFSESTPSKKSSIIIRQDYKKFPIANNMGNLNNSISNSVRNMHSLVENLSNLCDLQHKSRPLSNFEMQKKSELCEYLKLNPSASQSINVKQNRRSNRVKNLNAQLEQKEFDRRLNAENSESDKGDRMPKRTAEIYRRLSLNEINIDVPTTLQVHEISTTSTTRSRKSCQPFIDVTRSKRSNRCFSRKSDTLCNTSNRILAFSLSDSILNVPNNKIINFDDCIELFVPEIKINYRRQEDQKNKNLKKAVKSLSSIKSTIKSKSSRRFKRAISNMQFRSLRSKKILKRVKLESLLLKDAKRYRKSSRPAKRKNVPIKQFKSTELIQHRQMEGVSKTDTPASETEPSFGCVKEQDPLKNLTPEHRKALLESQKFLDMKVSICSKELQVRLETLVQQVECVDEQNETAAPSPCPEDMEVDRLLNGKTDNIEVSRPLKLNSNEVVVSQCAEKDWSDSVSQSSSSSTTLSSSSNSCSLETVASCPKLTNNNHEFSFTNDISVELPQVINLAQIEPTNCKYVPLSDEHRKESLKQCLILTKRKQKRFSRENSPDSQRNWDEHFETERPMDRKSSKSHTIYLSNKQGAIINAYYVNFNLIIVQEMTISFWNQSPLGNILGSHDMWIAKGSTPRLVLGNGCVSKQSSEMVICVEQAIAFVELWTKEHKSDKRERPVADIFVAIYLRLNRDNPIKKVLQLENINGYATDVQYVVLRNYHSIIVSWNTISDCVSSTLVHCYKLSSDFQTVISIIEMQTVQHYVSSLHNIEDCDTLIMGCGDNKLTLWNVEHGYIIATIDLASTKQLSGSLWVKSDRGFLFTLHNFNNGQLNLIGINSFDSTWKQLQIYNPGPNHTKLLGACIENGLVMAFYETGILCWKAKTGQLIMDDPCEDLILPFGNHVIVVLENEIHVRHALEYLVISTED